jgi:hypothetical protein
MEMILRGLYHKNLQEVAPRRQCYKTFYVHIASFCEKLEFLSLAGLSSLV